MPPDHDLHDFADASDRDRRVGPLRVGIGGPVGSGKTALAAALCRTLGGEYDLAVVTNDIYTTEDADFLRRNAEILRTELTEAGYGSVSLEFSAGQDAAPRDRGEETRRAYGGAEPPAPAPAPRAAALPGGLDIRL